MKKILIVSIANPPFHLMGLFRYATIWHGSDFVCLFISSEGQRSDWFLSIDGCSTWECQGVLDKKYGSCSNDVHFSLNVQSAIGKLRPKIDKEKCQWQFFRVFWRSTSGGFFRLNSHISLGQMEKCLVCGNETHGANCGAQTCRACCAFFRRTIIEKRVYNCKRDGQCEVKDGKALKKQSCDPWAAAACLSTCLFL